MTIQVLFVCSGNICRSAFAQAAAASLSGTSDVVFTSAGTHAMEGHPATQNMQRAGAELGIDLSAHRSTPLKDCDPPDVVFGMEQQHLVAAARRFPDLAAAQIRLLDHPNAIEDPYGLDLDTYRKTAATIMRAVAIVDFR